MILLYNNIMELQSKQEQAPEGNAAARPETIGAFMWAHRDAMRQLILGKLLEPVKGSKAKHGKEWKNVAQHCVEVGRGLDALADVLGLSEEDREKIVNVGLIHDWNKRLGKNAKAFTPEETAAAQEHLRMLMDRYDPDGMLLRSTEPEGLARLETDDATDLEHYVHFIDLSLMPSDVPRPLVPTRERIANLRVRQKQFNDNPDYPRFWDRKEELTERKEREILDRLRAQGREIPEGTRLCDLINERLGFGKKEA